MNFKALALLAVALLASKGLAQYSDGAYSAGSYAAGYSDSYGYDTGYYDGYGYGDSQYGTGASSGYDYSYNDEYGYYGDEDNSYYEYYGYYADDFKGYEYGDYYSEYESDAKEDCFIDANNRPVLSNTTASCDIKISDMDKKAPLVAGGIDGVYQLAQCYNGKAMYRRKLSPAGEDRVLWYSSVFGDWDISRGGEPNENQILAYGGDMEHASVPIFVSTWYMTGSVDSPGNFGADEFMPASPKIVCANGETPIQPMDNLKQPLLSPEELEKKYESIYVKYSRRSDTSPNVSFTFVVLMVMIGLTAVLSIPYFLLSKKGGKGSPGMSFSQMLQHSKKKQSGHIH